MKVIPETRRMSWIWYLRFYERSGLTINSF